MRWPADRWDRTDFLTLPLPDLLDGCNATVIEVPPISPRFLGGVLPYPRFLVVHMAIGLGDLEHETVLRGLLARWFGADTSDWPEPLHFAEGVPA